jgi:hypothetical protein
MELGTKIDTLYAFREARLELSRQVEEVKQMETMLRNDILNLLHDAGLAKASGLAATCGIKTSTEPVIEDWEQVHDYIRKENRFDLLQKRISAPAWRDLKHTGILVPGTTSVEVQDISLTKSTRS